MLNTSDPYGLTNRVGLASSYGFYYGLFGVVIPYLSIFLDGRGFNSRQIGELIAIVTLMRIIGPFLWASLADRMGRCLPVLRLGIVASALCFMPLFWISHYWLLVVFLSFFMLFLSAITAQMEVITLNAVRGSSSQYGRIRLWGSLGFIVMTVCTGTLIDQAGGEVLLPLSAGLLVGLVLVGLILSEPPTETSAQAEEGSIWGKMATPTFICFILAALLLQVSLAPYNGFFTLYMRDLGYSGEHAGWLIALGVLAEVMVFIYAGRFIQRVGIKAILVFSLLLTALRWFVLAQYADSLLLLGLSQLIHAASFGLTHAASIAFIHQYFGRKYQSRGQALYLGLAFGLGGAVGNLATGHIWQQGTGAELTFMLAMVAVVIAALLIIWLPSKNFAARQSV